MEIEKIIITDDMLESFVDMLKSPDADTGKLAISVLENRDKSNVESEKNFMSLRYAIISNEICFPKESRYVIKCDDRTLIVNGRMAFASEKDALRNLSAHFTKLIGTSPKPSFYKNYYKKQCRWNRKTYDENEMKKYVDKHVKAVQESMPYYTKDQPYFLALKRLFKGGKELRDFLIKENIVQIIKL